MGTRLVELQKDDFAKLFDYYHTFSIDQSIFCEENKLLMKTAHGIAFSMSILLGKISTPPEWSIPYLRQLRSDTIQLLPSVVLGGRRTLHLFERASIEDFFRYIFFFDHKIEHLLLQKYPTRFQKFDSLVSWAKEHPAFSANSEVASECLNKMTSHYAELSRTIHGTTIIDQQLLDSLQDLGKPITGVAQEVKRMKSLYANIFFLLSLFHLAEFRKLQLDEKTLICQRLSKQQVEALSGLD